jgi:hypothetical protein
VLPASSLLRVATEIGSRYPLNLTLQEIILRLRAEAEADAARPTLTHQEVIAAFEEAWTSVRGGRYQVVGGRDGKAAKQLLKFPDATGPEVRRRMHVALSDPWFQRAGTLATFVARWSNYDAPSAPAARRTLRECVGLDTDGRPVYA